MNKVLPFRSMERSNGIYKGVNPRVVPHTASKHNIPGKKTEL